MDIRTDEIPIEAPAKERPSPEPSSGEDLVRALIARRYVAELAVVGVAPDELADDLDLRAAGVIDSLGFLELVVELEQELGVELDFEALDPDLLTTVGPLVGHVAAQASTPQAA